MKITSIESQKNRPERRNIFADGQFLIGVGAETLIRSGLRRGDEITPQTLSLLQRMEETLGAKAAALRFLTIRPRSEREVRDKLREKEFGPEEIETTIDDLTKARLLDDAEFARAFIRNATAIKPTGAILLKRKLLLLGVKKETVEQALQEELAEADQHGAAAKAATAFLKRARTSRKQENPSRLRVRLTAFLLRRGYTWDIVEHAVKKSMLGGGDEDGEAGKGGI